MGPYRRSSLKRGSSPLPLRRRCPGRCVHRSLSGDHETDARPPCRPDAQSFPCLGPEPTWPSTYTGAGPPAIYQSPAARRGPTNPSVVSGHVSSRRAGPNRKSRVRARAGCFANLIASPALSLGQETKHGSRAKAPAGAHRGHRITLYLALSPLKQARNPLSSISSPVTGLNMHRIIQYASRLSANCTRRALA